MDDARDKEIARLAKDIEKAASSSQYVNSAGGKLHMDWLTAQLNQATNDILSDKFISDHNGYLDARSRAAFIRNQLATLTKLSSPDLEMQLRSRMELAQSESE